MSTAKKSKRIFYFDALRALAIISVIIIHVFSRTKGLILDDYSLYPSFNWLISSFSLSFFRIGVPLFLMLSGALSLGRDWEIRTFLGKRIPRIVAPFLFWGVTLSLVVICASYLFGFNWIDSYDWYSILNFIYQTLMFYNTPTFAPYWFFWMILGTYLIMPIFNKWLLHSELKEAEYFLFFWLITCIFDFTLKTPFPIKLTYFTSPIGLVVLGYYLRHNDRKLLNNPYFSIVLIIISAIAMTYFSYLNSTIESLYFFDRYSIFVTIAVIGVFTLFKNAGKFNINLKFLNNPNGLFRKSIFTIAKYSYGMYLVHNTIKALIYNFIYKLPINFVSMNILLLILTIFVSLIILSLLNRIPYVNQVIGAK